MNQILNRLVGADADIEITELRAVNSRVLIGILKNGLEGKDAVRLYVVEYVMQVYANEVGDSIRDGTRSADAGLEAERQLYGVLTAKARQIDIPDVATPQDIQRAISDSLGMMRRVMKIS